MNRLAANQATPMFEQPPAQLLPLRDALANLTAWFDWDALGAIGTVGALWFVIVEATRTTRAERANRIAVLTTLSSLTAPIAELVPIYDETGDDCVAGEEAATLAVAREAVDWAISGIKNITIAEAASVAATQYVTALPIALETLRGLLPKDGESARASSLNHGTAYVREAATFFHDQRELLEYGLAIRALRRAWAFGEHKLRKTFGSPATH